MTMIFGGIPFLREKQIVFPEGEFNLDCGTLSDLINLLGQPIAQSDPKSAERHCTFENADGTLYAFFHPASEISPTNLVLAIDYLPDKKMYLSRYAYAYSRDVNSLPYVPALPDEKSRVRNYMVIFSLNLHMICIKSGDLLVVETISFLSTNHVLTCECTTCTLIRNVMMKPMTFKSPQIPILTS